MGLIRSIINALEFCQAYRNPLEIAYNRRFNPSGDTRVVYRPTGTEIRCKVASQRLFGETWRDHDYDVPRIGLRRDDVVIDIGANQGFYSCYAAQHGARVFAFEPTPDLFQTLQSNIENTGFTARVTVRRCAVSDHVGKAEMILTDQYGGAQNTIVSGFAENTHMPVTGRVEVELTTLDAILKENEIDRVRICKLDCEGSELAILQSITPETACKVDAFVLEYHPKAYAEVDLVKLLLSWGTHQISYAEDKFCLREIIRAVRTDLLTT